MQISEIITEINLAKGNRNQSASTSEIRVVSKKIKKSGLDLKLLVKLLLDDARVGSLKLALSLIPTNNYYSGEFEEVIGLANHENWEIREYAADALSAILQNHFEELLEVLNTLSFSDSENVRRAIVVSLKYLGKNRNPTRCRPIITLISKFMNDTSPYVQRNLGAFAIGDGLIDYCPLEAIKMLKQSSYSSSDITRWNVAATFTAATASSFYGEIIPEISILLKDPVSRVRKTALKALKNIAERQSKWRAKIQLEVYSQEVVQLHGLKEIEKLFKRYDS
jgi:HEAT repeat protein